MSVICRIFPNIIKFNETTAKYKQPWNDSFDMIHKKLQFNFYFLIHFLNFVKKNQNFSFQNQFNQINQNS